MLMCFVYLLCLTFPIHNNELVVILLALIPPNWRVKTNKTLQKFFQKIQDRDFLFVSIDTERTSPSLLLFWPFFFFFWLRPERFTLTKSGLIPKNLPACKQKRERKFPAAHFSNSTNSIIEQMLFILYNKPYYK